MRPQYGYPSPSWFNISSWMYWFREKVYKSNLFSFALGLLFSFLLARSHTHLHKLKNENLKLEKKLQKLKNQSSEEADRLRDERQKNLDLQKENKDLSRKVSEFEIQHAGYITKLETLDKELSTQSNRIKQLEADNELKQEEIDALKQEKSKLEHLIVATQDKLAETIDELSAENKYSKKMSSLLKKARENQRLLEYVLAKTAPRLATRLSATIQFVDKDILDAARAQSFQQNDSICSFNSTLAASMSSTGSGNDNDSNDGDYHSLRFQRIQELMDNEIMGEFQKQSQSSSLCRVNFSGDSTPLVSLSKSEDTSYSERARQYRQSHHLFHSTPYLHRDRVGGGLDLRNELYWRASQTHHQGAISPLSLSPISTSPIPSSSAGSRSLSPVPTLTLSEESLPLTQQPVVMPSPPALLSVQQETINAAKEQQ